MAPTFGQRFSFARWWQGLVSLEESDAEFARGAYGADSSSSVTDYRRAVATPNTNRLVGVAERTGVDYKWLIGKTDAPADDFPDRELFIAAWARWMKARAEPTLTLDRGDDGGQGTPSKTGRPKFPTKPAALVEKKAKQVKRGGAKGRS